MADNKRWLLSDGMLSATRLTALYSTNAFTDPSQQVAMETFTYLVCDASRSSSDVYRR